MKEKIIEPDVVHLPQDGRDESGEGALSHALEAAQERTALALRGQLDSVIGYVKNSKLKLKEKAQLLSTLVRAHESLTKSERMTAGREAGHTTVNAGVIVIPQKSERESWHEHAVAEVERAKALGGRNDSTEG